MNMAITCATSLDKDLREINFHKVLILSGDRSACTESDDSAGWDTWIRSVRL